MAIIINEIANIIKSYVITLSVHNISFDKILIAQIVVLFLCFIINDILIIIRRSY